MANRGRRFPRSTTPGCRGKVRYKMKSDSLIAIDRAAEKYSKDFLRSYQCPHCNGWHMTSSQERANP